MNLGATVRVVFADDDPIVREVIRLSLAREPEVQVVGEASSGLEAIKLAKELQPDILLLDLLMPGLFGLGVLREMANDGHATRTIVVCSAISKRDILQALQLGARGILPKKSFNLLNSCLHSVLANKYWIDGKQFDSAQEFMRVVAGPTNAGRESNYGLTQRERQIVALVALGNTNRQISDILGISAETVKRHLVNIFDKVGMSNRLELAMFAIENGIASNA